MSTFSRRTVTMAAAGLTLAGTGIATALVSGDATADGPPVTPGKAVSYARPEQPDQAASAQRDRLVNAPAKEKKERKSVLPAGTSTATSFWDPATASGRPMSYHTLASPYWPLGTRVKISYHGKSVIGVVEDFGPAEWAVAQHDPPAIVDLSEKMMRDLTGTRSNAVKVEFEVIELGDGRVYRHSGTGYGTATGTA